MRFALLTAILGLPALAAVACSKSPPTSLPRVVQPASPATENSEIGAAVRGPGSAVLGFGGGSGPDQSWGTIKGQVVWAEKDVPEVAKVNVDKEQAHCLAKGPLLKDDLLIDAKSKGVKNVMVWLAPAAGGKIDVHPNLMAVPANPAVIDQPRCAFEPRITMMRAGQKLVIKNSAPVTHNSHLTGNPEINGTKNPTIPPGGNYEVTLKAEKRPLLLGCDIHGWMGGRIGVFDHPYFALTKDDGTFEIKDAPAGSFIIYVQHEKGGWLHTPREKKGTTGGSSGQPINIPAGGTLDLGKIEMKAEYLK